MRPIEGIVASVQDPAGRGRPPDTVLLTVPAHASFLATIQAAVRATVREVGGGDGDRDLQLAAGEAAAVLIEDARPWTVVHLSIAHDDTDIYVRLTTRRAQPARRLVIHELTWLLLDDLVESYELITDGRLAHAILQAAQDGAGLP